MAWSHGSYGSSVSNYRDSPVGVSPWAQGQRGRAATEPRQRGAALWSLMAGHGSRGRTLRDKRDGEVRGVHLRTKGGWRRSTGTWSRAVGSQVRNDGRLRGPSFKMASAALMTPLGNLSTGSALSAVPPRVNPIRFPLSSLGSPQPARPRPVSRVGPGVHFPVIPSSLVPRAARAHLSSRCEAQVRGVAVVASVTSSCSPGVSWTAADLRHLSRPWAQDSFIAATIMSAGPWGAQGTGIAGLLDSCPSPGSADRSVFPVRISPHS